MSRPVSSMMSMASWRLTPGISASRCAAAGTAASGRSGQGRDAVGADAPGGGITTRAASISSSTAATDRSRNVMWSRVGPRSASGRGRRSAYHPGPAQLVPQPQAALPAASSRRARAARRPRAESCQNRTEFPGGSPGTRSLWGKTSWPSARASEAVSARHPMTAAPASHCRPVYLRRLTRMPPALRGSGAGIRGGPRTIEDSHDDPESEEGDDHGQPTGLGGGQPALLPFRADAGRRSSPRGRRADRGGRPSRQAPAVVDRRRAWRRQTLCRGHPH